MVSGATGAGTAREGSLLSIDRSNCEISSGARLAVGCGDGSAVRGSCRPWRLQGLKDAGKFSRLLLTRVVVGEGSWRGA